MGLAGSQGAGKGGESIIETMVIDMNEAQVRTLEQVRLVVAGTQALEVRRAEDDEGRYGWIEQVLRRFEYRQLGRADKGAVLAYRQHLSGYSRAQLTRLVSRWGAANLWRVCERAARARQTGRGCEVVALHEILCLLEQQSKSRGVVPMTCWALTVKGNDTKVLKF